MNNDQRTGENIKNETKGRGLFYGVIAIATFIVMAVGATFAYFTATTNSMNSAVKTGSTTLQLKYISYGAGWMNDDLIPADTTVAEYSFEFQDDTTIQDLDTMRNGLCKDDYGNSICSVYVFQVKNEAASPQSVSLDVVSELNEFASLNAMAYEITIADEERYGSEEQNNHITDPKFRQKVDEEGDGLISVVDGNGGLLVSNIPENAGGQNEFYDPIFINRNGIEKTMLQYVESRDIDAGTSVKKPSVDRLLVTTRMPDGSDVQFENPDDPKERTSNIAGDITIEGGTTKTFALVLYIKNANIDQTATDAAKTFTGQVIISSGDGTTGVSGTISASVGRENDLASKQP